MKIGLAILAAGNGKRFGSNKLLADFDGMPMIRRVLHAIPPGMTGNTVIVTQYPEIAASAAEYGIKAVFNHAPDEGISLSVRLGTKSLADCDSVLFLSGDQPLLSERSIQLLLRAAEQNPKAICCASTGGERRSPCLFPKEFFPELMQLRGDRGGSAVIRSHPERILLIDLPEDELQDCDSPEELTNLLSRYGKKGI